MAQFFDREQWLLWSDQLFAWFKAEVWTADIATQGALIALAALASGWLGRRIDRWCNSALGRWDAWRRVAPFITSLSRPVAALILLRLAIMALRPLGVQTGLLVVASSLLAAWIIIRFASNFIRNRALARAFALTAWAIAALNILDWLDPLIDRLKAIGFQLGGSQITAYGILSGALTAILLIWGAQLLASATEQSLKRAQALNPSLQVLFGKMVRILLLSIAVLIALSSAGIDLTALAVFSGALGVGLGFGLQKVVSNFVSGIILLLDRSIKPGDVIEAQGTYGWINKLAARYTSVVTRDGVEYLIPNEDMVTQAVINWSHSDRNVRRRLPVQVAYSCDIKKAMELMTEAAMKIERVLKSPAPKALLKGFGADGVDLELRFWIDDPYNGVANVSSDVLLQIWDLFHENGIEFPFPQRDLHVSQETLQRLQDWWRAAGDKPKD
ncbi:MAG: mechanosensitive ion channel family protein [Pseudomonadota bacterium]